MARLDEAPEMTTRHWFYPESKFGDFTDVDGTVTYFNRINSLLSPSQVVLDVGCGRGAFDEDPVPFRRSLTILKGKVAKVMGIDVDPEAKVNPHIDEFGLIQGDTWPVETDSIDLIVCDCVVEHVEDPDQLFSEFQRVLKEGGCVCIRTPNRWSYISLAATLIPNRFHSKVTAAVQTGRKEEDVFPTVYKCNSARRLRNIMTKYGFNSVVYSHEAEPSYMSFSKIAYFFGVLHQKFAPRILKPTLFAYGRLGGEATDSDNRNSDNGN